MLVDRLEQRPSPGEVLVQNLTMRLQRGNLFEFGLG
jgi:hypothetical protein